MKPIILATAETPRAEWLALRRLGSSDAAAICGLNPWKTPFQVWLDKTGQAPEIEDNEAMMWGRTLEPIIAGKFSEVTGLSIEADGRLLAHLERPYMTATPDYSLLENGKAGLLEIKNTGEFNAKSWADGIPDAAHVQLMHQLAVTGLDFGYVCALVGGKKLVYHRFERDEALVARLIEIEAAFWERVESKTPPPLQAGDNDALALLYPTSTDSDVVLSETLTATIAEFEAAKAAIKEAEERKKTAEANLKLALGECERGRCGDYLLSWKTQERKEYVVKATSFRKFSIKNLTGGSNGGEE